jgi:hypothetical protein
MGRRYQVGVVAAVVLALASLTAAKWATPVEITAYKDPTRITKSMYTDSSSGATHIAYCNSSDGALYYTRLDESGLFLTGPTPVETKARCYHVDVTGPRDGQSVYLVFEARRSMSIENCGPSDLGACDDLFVLESRDGGDTWLPPKNLGGSPGDAYRRRGHKLLPNWKAKSFWLTYMKFNENDGGIAVVKFDVARDAFGPEQIVLTKYTGMTMYHTVTYNEKGDTTLMISYATPYSLALQTIVSTDGGVTWAKGEPLKTLCQGSGYVLRNLAFQGKYLVAACVKNDIGHFAFSEDNGKTWTPATAFPQRDLEEVTFCAPEDPLSPAGHLLILFHVKKSTGIASSPIPNLNFAYTPVPDAFYYAAFKMDLNCHYVAGALKLRYMYHVRSAQEGGNKYTLYIIDNDNIADEANPTMKVDL